MSLAFRCEVCDVVPQWSLMRRGDVAVSWACDPHLATVAHGLQRDWEITELIITDFRKKREWAEIIQSLRDIAAEKP